MYLELCNPGQKIAVKFTEISSIVGMSRGTNIILNNGKEFFVKDQYDEVMKKLLSFSNDNV